MSARTPAAPRGVLALLLAVLSLALTTTATAQLTPNPNKPFFLPANVPTTDDDPLMEGAATDNPEWADAMRLPDSFFFKDAGRSGFYYFERRDDWTATPYAPVDGGITYPGSTLFIAHDIIGSSNPDNPLHQFQVAEPHDWNSFTFPVPGGEAKIWVFNGENDDDDANWLPFAEGLIDSHLVDPLAVDMLDDRGFVARLNGDPLSDVHWMETDPEPGDPGWVWEDWHYVFGRHTFGQSFQDVLLDPDPNNAVDHEVYEACGHKPDGGGGDPPPFCLWWEEEEVEETEPVTVVVMEDGTPVKKVGKLTTKKKVPVLRGQWWLHDWDPGVYGIGVPDASTQANMINSMMSASISKSGAEPNAITYAFFAQSHLFSMVFALVALDYAVAFQQLKFLDKFMTKSVKKGFPTLAWMQLRMTIVAFFYYTVATHLAVLEAFGAEDGGGGIPIDDKDLIAAHKGLYKFGLALQKSADKGGIKGQERVLKTLKKLKKVTKRIEKLQSTP